MPSPSTCFYIAVGAEALEGAREWGEVWVISYSEEPQILSPPGCSWHQGKASKANLCLDGEVGDGFSVPVFGTHMERPDPPPQEEARPRQKNSCNPKQGSLERRAKSTSLEITGLWGLREVRKDEECSLPKPLATHVLNSTLLLSSMKILNGPTYPPWESSYPHKSLPAQSDQMCAMYTRRTISLLLFAASLF